MKMIQSIEYSCIEEVYHFHRFGIAEFAADYELLKVIRLRIQYETGLSVDARLLVAHLLIPNQRRGNIAPQAPMDTPRFEQFSRSTPSRFGNHRYNREIHTKYLSMCRI